MFCGCHPPPPPLQADAGAEGDAAAAEVAAAAKQRAQAAQAAQLKFRNSGGDALSVLSALCAYEAAGEDDGWCQDNHLHGRHLREMMELRRRVARPAAAGAHFCVALFGGAGRGGTWGLTPRVAWAVAHARGRTVAWVARVLVAVVVQAAAAHHPPPALGATHCHLPHAPHSLCALLGGPTPFEVCWRAVTPHAPCSTACDQQGSTHTQLGSSSLSVPLRCRQLAATLLQHARGSSATQAAPPLLRQLSAAVAEACGATQAQLAPPGPQVQLLLRQALAAGWADQVTARLGEGGDGMLAGGMVC